MGKRSQKSELPKVARPSRQSADQIDKQDRGRSSQGNSLHKQPRLHHLQHAIRVSRHGHCGRQPTAETAIKKISKAIDIPKSRGPELGSSLAGGQSDECLLVEQQRNQWRQRSD